jgi:methylmalonyl-CoA mutase, C-terminal domain
MESANMSAPNSSSPPNSGPAPAGAAPVRRKLRILVAKAGLDGHDRGAKVVARALADAGYEVIYTGLHQTPEMIAATALQESADAVGLSVLSGAHMTLFPALLAALKARGAEDVLVFGGGIVPKDDAAALAAQGVAAIFTPGTSTRVIVEWIERDLRPRVEAAAARFASDTEESVPG